MVIFGISDLLNVKIPFSGGIASTSYCNPPKFLNPPLQLQKYGRIQNQRPQNCGNTDFCQDRCKIEVYPPLDLWIRSWNFQKNARFEFRAYQNLRGSLLMPFGHIILHLQTNFSGKKWCFRPLCVAGHRVRSATCRGSRALDQTAGHASMATQSNVRCWPATPVPWPTVAHSGRETGVGGQNSGHVSTSRVVK